MISKQFRLLVVAGPPGVGKSVSIRSLSQELNIKLRSWSDIAVDGGFDRRLREGMMTQLSDFERFLHEAKYSSLPKTLSSDPQNIEVLLIENLPSLFTAEQAQEARRIFQKASYLFIFGTIPCACSI